MEKFQFYEKYKKITHKYKKSSGFCCLFFLSSRPLKMSKNASFFVIKIPTTKSISNFIRVFHPEKLMAYYADPTGLTLAAIISRRNKANGEIDFGKFSDTISLHLSTNDVLRSGGKVLRPQAVIAIHEFITKLLYRELEYFVASKTVRFMGKRAYSIKEAIELFQEKYSLCEQEFNYIRLQKHIQRKRTTQNEL